jgi:DUF4097 and DUF4098 domain-containing protein YvlB
MKKNYWVISALGFCLCLPLVLGCSVLPSATYTRTVQLSAPLSAGSTFSAQTHNGSITVEGVETADCNVTAKITARAGTEEEAKKLAEETKVTLEPLGNKLTAKIQKPLLVMNQSVSVSLDVMLPNQANLELTTHNGAINVTDIIGRINATTHNGGVTAESVSSTMELQTHNGGIEATCSKSASPVCDVSIVTHNGGINFIAPPNLSASVDVSTHNGSIKTDLPMTVTEKVSKRKLIGTIGRGQGKLHLETHKGSIKIK